MNFPANHVWRPQGVHLFTFENSKSTQGKCHRTSTVPALYVQLQPSSSSLSVSNWSSCTFTSSGSSILLILISSSCPIHTPSSVLWLAIIELLTMKQQQQQYGTDSGREIQYLRPIEREFSGWSLTPTTHHECRPIFLGKPLVFHIYVSLPWGNWIITGILYNG